MSLDPAVTFTPDLHRYDFAEEEIEVVLDRFKEARGGGLVAEITVTTSREPRPGLLLRDNLNLVSSRTKRGFVKGLEERTASGFLDNVDFGGVIELVCNKSLQRWREGDPTIDLREVEPGERPRWREEPFVEEAGGNLLFGDGGTAKSTVGDTILTEIASGRSIIGGVQADPQPSMILDWEADQWTHAERLAAICAGTGLGERPPVFYRRQVASLIESAPTIRKEIAKLGIGFVVIDSMGAARGGDPESADVTIRLFNAARSLGVPWLGIDHVPKNAHDKSKPFGSTYSHNLARLTWGVEKHQEEGSDEVVIALTNHKRNNGPLLRRRAYRIRFESSEDGSLAAIRFGSCDPLTVPELTERLPVKDRILSALRDGKMTAKGVADVVKVGEMQARARLNDLAKADKVGRIGNEWGLRYDE